MPVREALRRLEAEGLVTFDANRKIKIKDLSLKDVEELFLIRMELEDLALRSAVPALRNDEEVLARLDELIAQMDKAEGDLDAWQLANQEFHRLLYQAAEMPRLGAIISSLWVAVQPYLRLASTVENLRAGQEQHRKIVRLVRAGDARGAGGVLREHLRMTLELRRARLEYLDSATESGDGGELELQTGSQ